MDLKVLLILILLPSSGSCAVTYISLNKPNLKMVEEGTSVVISCYFKGDKPPGLSLWKYNGQVLSYNCHVDSPGEGIITPTDDCSPDKGDGHAKLSFIIHKVSLDRDQHGWTCQNFDLNELLHIPITVIGNSNSTDEGKHYKNEDDLTMTADIGCSYPPDDILWCLDDGIEVKCSDKSNWTANVFEGKPIISQTTATCNHYNTPYVLRYQSRIKGKIISQQASYSTEYTLYCSMNGIHYKNIGARISVKGTCPNSLPKTTITVQSLSIVLLFASIIYRAAFRVVVGRKKYLRMNRILLLCLANTVLFVTSVSLCIPILVLCKDRIGLTFGLLGFTILLSIIHLLQIRRCSSQQLKNYNYYNLKSQRQSRA